jgi:hypothetical protein
MQRYNAGGALFNIETGANATDNFAIHRGAPFNDFVIGNTGNVGIGIANPGASLDVNGPIQGRGQFIFYRPGVSDIRAEVSGPGYPNNVLSYFSSTTGTRHDLMTLDEQGNLTAVTNVGAGRTAILSTPPSYALNQGLTPLYWNPATKEVCFGIIPLGPSGPSQGSASTSASGHMIDVGSVPEDAKKSIADLVQSGKGGQSEIDYGRLPLYLLEVVKAQQKTIEALRAEVDHLKSK